MSNTLIDPELLPSFVSHFGYPTTCNIVNYAVSNAYPLLLERSGGSAKITPLQAQHVTAFQNGLTEICSLVGESLTSTTEKSGDSFIPQTYSHYSKFGPLQEVLSKGQVGGDLLELTKGLSNFFENNRGKVPAMIQETLEHGDKIVKNDQIMEKVPKMLEMVLRLANAIVPPPPNQTAV